MKKTAFIQAKRISMLAAARHAITASLNLKNKKNYWLYQKRVYRLYAAEGLSIRRRKKTKRVGVSAAEWTPSDNMAELLVIPATMNFITAMATLAPVAP